jgi:hypothetical protein
MACHRSDLAPMLALALTLMACDPTDADRTDASTRRDGRAGLDAGAADDAGARTVDARPGLDADHDAEPVPSVGAATDGAASDGGAIDGGASDGGASDTAVIDAARDARLPPPPPAETCLYGTDPHPCDGAGYWVCDAGVAPMIGVSRGEYVYTWCVGDEECVERAGGAPPIQGYCEPRDRECDLFAAERCSDDGRVLSCVDGHWRSVDVCGAGGAPLRCASIAGDPETWRCVDDPLVPCDSATYASHCREAAAVECESVGYVRSIACTSPRPACVTGRGHSGCTTDDAAPCDPDALSFACSPDDPDLVLACASTGHLTPVARCLRTSEAVDCECTTEAVGPSADTRCAPATSSGSGAICATARL